MLPTTISRSIALLAVIVLFGVAGLAGPAVAAQDQPTAEPDCAVEPPEDRSDPDEDVLGWEEGYWYDVPLSVDQDDGLNESELEAVLARTMARVEAIRCLEFEGTVPVEIITREEFRERELERDVSPDLRTFDNAKFEALFLIDESTDSIEIQNRNRGTSVLGYYDPANDTIVVVSEDPETLRLDEVTLAHELVHALQDRRYDLTSSPFDVRIRDDANAVSGLVEGDASYVDALYERRCQGGAWNGTCLSQPSPEGGDLANIGVYFINFQPYSDGPSFVAEFYEEGGWDAVDDLYEDPPATSEQIIDPEKYPDETAADLTVEDRTTDDWTVVRPPERPNYAEVGESGLASMFVYPTYHSEGETQIVPIAEWVNANETGEVDDFDPIDYETDYSSGWDGDRLRVYENEDGELAYVWKLAWDTEADAEEFVEGYEQVLEYWGAEQVGEHTYLIEEGGFADAFHVTMDGRNVTIVNAPSVEQLPEVRQGIDVEESNEGNGSATVR